MKLDSLNLITISIVVGVVLCLTVPTKPLSSTDEFPVPVATRDQEDFIVKFKGKIFSWNNLSQLLRQHNITVPDDVLAAVLQQKTSKAHTCRGRCFLDERKYHDKTCFCDAACRTFKDCCLDFYSGCRPPANDAFLQNVTCGDVDKHSWSGVIMKSSCSSHGNQTTNDCQTVERLNMMLLKELPVFDLEQNVTYRSIACAKCENEGNLSFWGLDISCAYSSGSKGSLVNITAIKKFLKEHSDCSWKYKPRTLNQHFYRKSCVLPDPTCSSSHLPVLSVVRELCSLYSMVFSVGIKLAYRNPHCALCNPNGRPLAPRADGPMKPMVPPLSVLLDVSANIPDEKETKKPIPTLITDTPVQAYNLSTQMFNCTTNTTNCTTSFGGLSCDNFTSKENQSTQMRFYLNNSHVIIRMSQKQNLDEKNTTLEKNTVYFVCPEQQTKHVLPDGQVDKDTNEHDSSVLSYITLTGTLVSIISLCFLLTIYLSFKDLRNLPGKCLINLSLALLCYQAIFLSAEKSKEVEPLCKAVAILLHFFLLAAFSWMSVMAFDTAKTFTVKVSHVRQPSDSRKTFIKYCIVGWGLTVVIVILCSVLDFTGTVHFGYGMSTYCWISDKTAIAVAMVTPVSLALVFNIMCLTKSVYVIRKLKQDASQATSNSSRVSLTLICIKLTSVMGLTWILGLIANWKQTAFLHYPSTLLSSMQGLFIALSFITTKKVRGLLRNAFLKRWNGAVEPQTSSSIHQRTATTDGETTAGSRPLTKNARPENCP